jgi:hypothetical protein
LCRLAQNLPPRQSAIMLSNKELRLVEKAGLPFDSRGRAVARTATAILVLLLAAWVARDFLVALTWAALISIATWPIYIRFMAPILGGRSSVLAAA